MPIFNLMADLEPHNQSNKERTDELISRSKELRKQSADTSEHLKEVLKRGQDIINVAKKQQEHPSEETGETGDGQSS